MAQFRAQMEALRDQMTLQQTQMAQQQAQMAQQEAVIAQQKKELDEQRQLLDRQKGEASQRVTEAEAEVRKQAAEVHSAASRVEAGLQAEATRLRDRLKSEEELASMSTDNRRAILELELVNERDKVQRLATEEAAAHKARENELKRETDQVRIAAQAEARKFSDEAAAQARIAAGLDERERRLDAERARLAAGTAAPQPPPPPTPPGFTQEHLMFEMMKMLKEMREERASGHAQPSVKKEEEDARGSLRLRKLEALTKFEAPPGAGQAIALEEWEATMSLELGQVAKEGLDY
jgi:hypothetical protein